MNTGPEVPDIASHQLLSYISIDSILEYVHIYMNMVLPYYCCIMQIYLCTFQVGDDIEIRPGIVTKDEKGNVNCAPIATKVVSLRTENTDLQSALPGGLIGR